MSSLLNIALPKPKDWQDFERKTWALFKAVLNDPNTQMNGRVGQPQHGVDIWGYRNQDLSKLVGIQCKLSRDAITAEELNAELDKAKGFAPATTEFFLITTAPRDAKIQQTAREITQSLVKTDRPILVEVWGWEDIEETAANYADVWKIFDPTFNPFAEQASDETRSRFDALENRLESINLKIASRQPPAPTPSVSAPPSIQAYFSYAHHDEGTDPELVQAFSNDLQRRVQGHLVKDKFQIWRDTLNLRTGDDWNKGIEEAIRASDVFIALVTPRWLASSFCQREYMLFRDAEREMALGSYVVPIIVRNLEKEMAQFDTLQKEIFEDLQRRQYRKVLATDFRNLSADQRIAIVENVAGDVHGIILRIRELRERVSSQPTHQDPRPPTPPPKSPNSRPHRFPDTDLLRTYEVLVGPATDGVGQAIYAQADFFDRLYIEDGDVRLEFGIYRAKLTVANTGPGKVSRSELLEERGRNTYYANPDGEPLTHTVFVEATPDKPTLGELAFMPTKGDNRYAEVARATGDVAIQDLNATLEISLNSEGLFFEGDALDKPSPSQRLKIAAIVLQLAKKEPEVASSYRAKRVVPIKERKP